MILPEVQNFSYLTIDLLSLLTILIDLIFMYFLDLMCHRIAHLFHFYVVESWSRHE